LLTFVIPVRHQDTVEDWASVKQRLTVTLRSIAAQTNPNWNVIIAANEGADLPDCPPKVDVVRVDFPSVVLAGDGTPMHRSKSVQIDKGRRILVGLLAARPTGHVMVVDYDDMISCHLAAFVEANQDANGWFFDDGYLYSGEDQLFQYDKEFYLYCGPSHIIRADLLEIPARFEDAKPGYVIHWLGAHIFIKSELDRKETPLARLPFRGAIYRVGYRGSTSSSLRLPGFIRKMAGDDEAKRQELLSKVIDLTPDHAAEFFGGQAE